MFIGLGGNYECVVLECNGDHSYALNFKDGPTIDIPDETMVQIIEAILEYDPAIGEMNTREGDKYRLRQLLNAMNRWHGIKESMEYRRQIEDEVDAESAAEDGGPMPVSH